MYNQVNGDSLFQIEFDMKEHSMLVEELDFEKGVFTDLDIQYFQGIYKWVEINEQFSFLFVRIGGNWFMFPVQQTSYTSTT